MVVMEWKGYLNIKSTGLEWLEGRREPCAMWQVFIYISNLSNWMMVEPSSRIKKQIWEQLYEGDIQQVSSIELSGMKKQVLIKLGFLLTTFTFTFHRGKHPTGVSLDMLWGVLQSEYPFTSDGGNITSRGEGSPVLLGSPVFYIPSVSHLAYYDSQW